MSLRHWALLMSVWSLAISSRALACGGCFAPPQMSASEVVGHRMVFAVSDDRTVLWDQFEYTGAPEEFSWVLPITPGAYVEEAEQAWFDALDAATQKTITGPRLTCGNGDGNDDFGCACGAMVSADSADASGSSFQDPDSVHVVDRRTVGPYDVVTLHSEAGDELFRWFEDNGYFVPEDIAPIIEAYVSEGSDFIAVKLRPGQGVQQMTPVRVITPGGEGLLPLRMVAAGVRDQVDIVLYVIAEQRYKMPDLTEVYVSEAELVWDFEKSDSNYLRLRQSALSKNGGFSYLTAFAGAGVFAESGLRAMTTTNGSFVTNLADLYQAQAAEADGIALPCPANLIAQRLATPMRVVEDWDGIEMPASGALACGEYTDLATAMVGLRPDRAWITRLELTLPRYALSMDCILEPHETTDEVSAFLTATKSKGVPNGCRAAVFSSTTVAAPPADPRLLLLLLVAGVAAAAVTRRHAFV